MKKFTYLFIACCCTFSAFGQGPFTITADNFPIFGIQNFNGPNAPNGNIIIPAPNGNWDLSSYHGSATAVNDYTEETLDFYTAEGIDVYITGFKSLTPNLGYRLDNEIDFNEEGVFDKGLYIEPQAYSLGALSGNPLDSLTFPLQGAIFFQGRQIMKFPATYKTAWHSESRQVVDFNLTVAAAGLNKTPGNHVFTVFRQDTIIGWGKMRVYTSSGPSTAYPVLVHRSSQFAVDSFFLGGAPAPATLLSAFGMTQGQKTNQNHRYTIYREGRSTPLALNRFTSNTFNTPQDYYVDTENLSTTGLFSPDALEYSALLFPNPSHGGALTLMVSGNIPSVSHFEILDMQGRLVQNGTISLEGGTIRIPVSESLPDGSYLLQVLDDKKQTVISERFERIN